MLMDTEFNDYTYDKLLTLTARYNRRIHLDKLSRLPFLDNATGIAQRPCLLYRRNCEREAGVMTKVFRYPQHKWKKTKRLGTQLPVVCTTDLWIGAPNGTGVMDSCVKDAEDEDSRSTWAAGPDYDLDSDASDFIDDNYSSRRKKRKTKSTRISRALGSSGVYGRRRSQPNYAYDDDVSERQLSTPMFVCEICGVRYRSRTGLNYHYNSQHPHATRVGSGRISAISDLQNVNHQHSTLSNGALCANFQGHSSHTSGRASDSNTGVSPSLLCTLIESADPPTTHSSTSRPQTVPDSGSCIVEPGAGPSCTTATDYTCDFCLGDVRLNRKTGLSEGMLRCSDCGRCAHFSCLQFTANMITSVRTYRWQCIECKTCWLCGTSENDEQMLFCDDCDRGYHLYCLSPPLDEPPEGSWSCKLCVDHFQESSASYHNSSMTKTPTVSVQENGTASDLNTKCNQFVQRPLTSNVTSTGTFSNS